MCYHLISYFIVSLNAWRQKECSYVEMCTSEMSVVSAVYEARVRQQSDGIRPDRLLEL